MAKVKQIKVCGSVVTTRLYNTCSEYIVQVNKDTNKRQIRLEIELDTGEVKTITLRQEANDIRVYGTFEGMPGK